MMVKLTKQGEEIKKQYYEKQGTLSILPTLPVRHPL